MKKLDSFLLISVLFMAGIFLCAQEGQNIRFTIIYDNTAQEDLTPDWGFACIVESEEKNILFDTGTKPEILVANMEKLKIGFNLSEIVIISHNHDDHTGGLQEYLSKNSHVPVYLPASSPNDFINLINDKSDGVILKPDPYEVCKGVYLTGEMGTVIKEQSMVFDLGEKIVVMTGCAHTGIVNIVKRAKEIVNKDIYLVFGGFHLMDDSEEEIDKIIGEFRKLGVQKCGATHCTGEKQIEIFRKAFGKDFVELGAGKVLDIKDGDLINTIQ